MIDLRLTATDMSALCKDLLSEDLERCAVLLASRSASGRESLLVREVILPEASDYAKRSRIDVELKPEFVARITKRAKDSALSLVFVHSHPNASPHFSRTDDEGEQRLSAFLNMRGLLAPHASIVVSPRGIHARILGGNEPIRVVSAGELLTIEFDPNLGEATADPKFDRQVRALGADGQQVLQTLRVGIVGLGGTGSIAVQQLAHLGVQDFVLIDPDYVDLTNLNRVVGTGAQDVGHPKVNIAERHILSIAPVAKVNPVFGDVTYANIANELSSVDIIVCCTDSHGSRSVVQQVAYQYLIPCIDIGSTITTQDGQITGIFGRVQLLGPDQACLWCSGLLNSEQVRRDLMSPFERKADPYIQGAHEPAPAVISLNGTVVSLAITMLLGIVTPVPVSPRYLIYNATASTLRPVHAIPSENCFICSRQGVLARGNKQVLFARQD